MPGNIAFTGRDHAVGKIGDMGAPPGQMYLQYYQKIVIIDLFKKPAYLMVGVAQLAEH